MWDNCTNVTDQNEIQVKLFLPTCTCRLILWALTHEQLGLGDKGNWESTKVKQSLMWIYFWPVTCTFITWTPKKLPFFSSPLPV